MESTKKWGLGGTDGSGELFMDETFTTVEELDALLLRALEKTDGEALFSLSSPSGSALTFGMSRDHAFVEFSDEPDVGPYFMPIANPALSRDDGVADFMFTGSYTEIPLRNCLRPDQVGAVVREFFKTDVRPASMHWED